MTCKIVKNRLQIEEIYYPSYLRAFHRVTDILTDNDQIPIEIDGLLGLEVIALNSSNRTIRFLEMENPSRIMLILDLDSFPLINDEIKEHYKIEISEFTDKSAIRFVKLDMKYLNTVLSTEIQDSLNRSNNIEFAHKPFLLAKKASTIEIRDISPSEISITLPIGWRIGGSKWYHRIFPKKKKNRGGLYSIFNFLLKEENNKEGYSVGMKYISKEYNSKQKIDGIDLSSKDDVIEANEVGFNRPIKTMNGDKRTYLYSINDKSSKEMKIKHLTSDGYYLFSYISQISSVLFLIAMVPYILFLPISVAIMLQIFIDIYTSFFPITITTPNIIGTLIQEIAKVAFKPEYALMLSILTFSFFGVEYNMIREGINIPFKYHHYFIFSVVLFTILLILFHIYIFPLIVEIIHLFYK
jgi:hypothetical protein